MLHATLPAETLYAVLNALTAVVEKCELRFDDDGLSVQAAQPNEMQFALITLPDTVFDAYNADNVAVTVTVSELEKNLTCYPIENPVTLSLTDNEKTLRFHTPSLTYNHSLSDPPTTWTPTRIPTIASPVTFELTGADLNRIVTVAGWISSRLRVEIDSASNLLYCEATGDTDAVSERILLEAIDHLDITSSATYPLKYVLPIQHSIPDTTAVHATLDTESSTPLKLQYPLSDHGGHVTYYIRSI
jgi:DNA polymerase III sliding clamp (beta) subunit (PCNA family)